MPHYLIVWGRAAEQIRSGSGPDERSAAREAFGSYDPKRMTFKKATLGEMRSDAKRTWLCYLLLLDHADHMKAHGDEGLKEVVSALDEAAELKRKYAPKWRRYDKKVAS